MKMNTRILGALALALPLIGWAPFDVAEFVSLDLVPALGGESAQADDGATDPIAPPAPDLPAEVDRVVANLQASYDDIRDLQATFTQESTQIALGDTRTSSGRVYFLRPGRMVWDYDDQRRLVLDGESLHSVDIANGQYYSAPISDSELPTAMRFLVGEGRLADDFDITLQPESDDERAVLDLVPHVPSAEYERLLFVVDRSTWTVVETTIVDVLGNTNTIRFADVQTNVGMQADAFVFEPTPGLTRIDVPD